MKWTVHLYFVLLVAALILYSLFIKSDSLDYFGNLAQIIFLALSSWNLGLARENFSRGEKPRKAWTALSAGMLLWMIGQCFDAYCEIILKEVPYGTISDVFWLLGYVPLIIGLAMLIKNFKNSGLFSSIPGIHILILGALTAAYIFLFSRLTLPQLNDPERLMADKLLDVAYPVLDFALIALSIILVRYCWVLRGGLIARSWTSLSLGFILVAAADIYISTVTNVESAGYRFLDILYFSAYFLIALAGLLQIRILRTV
jgi:hypothetical protein